MLGMGYEEIELLARIRMDDAIKVAERRRLARPATPTGETGACEPVRPRRPIVLRWIPRPNR